MVENTPSEMSGMPSSILADVGSDGRIDTSGWDGCRDDGGDVSANWVELPPMRIRSVFECPNCGHRVGETHDAAREREADRR